MRALSEIRKIKNISRTNKWHTKVAQLDEIRLVVFISALYDIQVKSFNFHPIKIIMPN
jgi:tRNA A37 threonylcarbamoyladenosine synthetase subunit TsaC/SUA5/YrdC